jgi:small subunit ribosomal protein S19
MARSLWKGPFCEITLNQKVEQKLFSRRSMILPQFVGKTFYIHNGKSFIPCKISEEMIGAKLGEFASTRKKPVHKKKVKNAKKR